MPSAPWPKRRLSEGCARTRSAKKHIRRHLYTAHMPDPDLVVRTSGELRVSNFLLWQIAYSEIYVTDRLWPDFRGLHLLEAIEEYQRRERRYGGLSDGPESDETPPYPKACSPGVKLLAAREHAASGPSLVAQRLRSVVWNRTSKTRSGWHW